MRFSKVIALVLPILSHPAFCQQPIDSSMIFSIGGIRQFVYVKGKDRMLPLLLFLHGGPGSSLMQKSERITSRLQEHFVVVQWDQRETGETLRMNASPERLTLQQFYNDTHELIDSLMTRLNKSKIFLAGYSWGSVLGFYMADKYPAKLYAFLAISPVIQQAKSDSIALSMIKHTMGAKARRELASVKIPFENADQLYSQRKWLLKFEGKKFLSLSFRKEFVINWAKTWFELWSCASEIDRFASQHSFQCPLYFFAGESDYLTNHSITRQYFNHVTAPQKDFFLFEDAGHELLETHSASLQEIIINKILPETINH
jgi:pimeloyl-ACP methyl ester carboxylesterase